MCESQIQQQYLKTGFDPLQFVQQIEQVIMTISTIWEKKEQNTFVL